MSGFFEELMPTVVMLDFYVPPGGVTMVSVGERADKRAYRVDVKVNGERVFRSPNVPTRQEAEELADDIERILMEHGLRRGAES
jgi:hypothetical protein